MRLANENGLLQDMVENWLQYAQARINTSHDYSGVKAKSVLMLIGNFINDAIGLYQTMSGKSWQQ